MGFSGTERFQLLDKLGEGGMGIVYEAFDRVRGMPVAIKTLRHVKDDNLQRFKREFRALHNLSHPNIIHFYELFSENGVWFLTMELVSGRDFIDYVRDGRTCSARPPIQHTSAQDTRTIERAAPTAEEWAAAREPGDSDILPTLPASTVALDEIVDVGRLRDALGQLADALQALHTANMVHRDLKPSNVRVTPEGRVVLMDFGIVSELGRSPENDERRMLGTPSFMAPEQVLSERPSPASDWYSLGVMLYAALTGRLPFEGERRALLRMKGAIDPWPPSCFTHNIPGDLESLCVELLTREPERRPSGADVLARLGIAVSDAATSAEFPVLDTATELFVGRRRELGMLRAAYAKVQTGEACCAFVAGPPGIGRSTLVRRFLYDIRTRDARRPLVLSGHSRAREVLAYKAFDGIVDDLAGHLSELVPAERARLLDEESAAIGWLFPAFERVLASPRADADADAVHDPYEQRARAIAALRALLSRLANERAVVLYTDDIQWADRDSLELLLALLRGPAPPALLMLSTLRTGAPEVGAESSADPHLERIMAALEHEVDCRHIGLGPLSEAEQRDLMERMALLPQFEGVSRHLESPLWRESAGNPMLLAELARSTSDTPHDLAARGMLHLDDVIWSRFSRLPEDARALMECIVLAREPLPLTVLAVASGLSSAACERASSSLRVSHMVRIERSDHEPWLVAYHDKVCEAVRDRLPIEHRRELHRAIAVALDAWGEASHALLADQWLAAGEPVKALHHRFQAARQAAGILAMERAASLYQATLETVPEPHPNAAIAHICCRASVGLAEALIHDNGDRDRALELLGHARDTAEEHQLLPELALIHHHLGSLHFPHGDLERCMAEHERARHYAQRISSPRLGALSLSAEADALYARGKVVSAHARYQECAALCREHGLRDIAVHSRALGALTSYFQADLARALTECNEAADEAARIRYQRTELIARSFPLPWTLFDMGRLHHATHSLERALELCRKLDAHHFEPIIFAHQARILATKGRRERAAEHALRAVERCREGRVQFFGPIALVALAQVTGDAATRARALDEAVALLGAGSWSHCHLIFYRDAMDVALAAGELERAAGYADALERYTADEPLAWSQFFVARGRVLCAHARGEAAHAELARVRAEARRLGMHTPAAALDKALGRGR